MSTVDRSRKGIGFLAAPAFVLALALSAAAQEKPITSSKEMSDTVKITVSGQVVLDYVWRSTELMEFKSAAFFVPPGNDSANDFEGHLALRVNVDLSDKVSAVIEIGTKRADLGNIDPWADGPGENIGLREAAVVIREFLDPALTIGIGIPNWSFDVRGKGSAFAFDPRRSQSITRNLDTNADGAAALGARAGTVDELEPVGIWGKYQRDALTFEVIALPAVLEGGAATNDEAFYAVDLWYNLDNKGSRFGAILALSAFGGAYAPGVLVGKDPGDHTGIFTLGAGATLKGLVDGLELYGEVYFQFGDAGQQPDPVGPGEEEVDAGGMAFQIGFEYVFKSDIRPWIGVNFTMVSGDDDTLADDEVSNFLSYENVNDLMIIEDMYFGFDWDTNYTAIKISGGFAMSVGQAKNNLELSAIVGIVSTSEDVEFGAPVGGEDALGMEVDVKARWVLTKQASLNAAVAFLFGSDVMEESFPGGGTSPNAEDGAMLYTVGADLRF